MKRDEKDPNHSSDSYQCDFVLVPRKETIKELDELAGQESVEVFPLIENKA